MAASVAALAFCINYFSIFSLAIVSSSLPVAIFLEKAYKS
jgi:hypothetical protein